MVARASSSPAVHAPAARRSHGPHRPPSLRRLAVVYLALLAAGALVVLVASTVMGAVTAGTSGTAAVGVTEAGRGENLFLTSCASCHGSQGAGTAKGPDIRNAGAALADFMLRTGRMPLADPAAPARRGTPYFSDADREAIVAYVASLGSGPAIPDVVVDGADATAGRGLFVTNCSACHGPSGGGGAVGGGFVAPALDQADPTTVGEAVVSGPGPMPRFSFSPQDLNNLAAYVEYLRDAPHPGGLTSPSVGPVTEGFVAGLTLLVLLVVARWVAVRRSTGPSAAATAVTPPHEAGPEPGSEVDE